MIAPILIQVKISVTLDKRLFNSLLGSALEKLSGLHCNCRDNCNGLRATRLVTCSPRGLTAPEDMCQIQLPVLARFFSGPILLAFFWISHTAPLFSGVSDSLYAACHTRAYPVIRKYRHFPACSREIPSSSNERERLIAPVVSVPPVTQQQAGLLLGLPRSHSQNQNRSVCSMQCQTCGSAITMSTP